MFIIVRLKGGLGNQMFAYAFYLALRHKYRFSINLIEPVDCFNSHSGYELPGIFKNIRSDKSNKFYRRLKKIHSRYLTKHIFKKQCEISPCSFYPKYVNSHFLWTVYEGYWQSEKYFTNIISDIHRTYIFDDLKLNLKSKELIKLLEKENSISIHIRRQDYLDNHELGEICTIQYYRNAISQ